MQRGWLCNLWETDWGLGFLLHNCAFGKPCPRKKNTIISVARENILESSLFSILIRQCMWVDV